MAIAGVCIGAIVYGYTTAAIRAEWSAHSLAAQSLAMQVLEQVQGAQWNVGGDNPSDQLTTNNFQPVVELSVPVHGGTAPYATNHITITKLSDSPPEKMIRVDCVWSFKNRIYTNTVMTYRAGRLQTDASLL